jgi:competence ComEA-like helix-hairpin-helix protein
MDAATSSVPTPPAHAPPPAATGLPAGWASAAASVPVSQPLAAANTLATVVAAWPRSAQLLTAFLLGIASALLSVNLCGYSRWGARPAELERTAGFAYRVDLNRAGREELVQLPGVADGLAQRIEDYRREHGPFRSVNDLAYVQSIGAATLERLRPWVCVEGSDAEPGTPALKRRQTATRAAETPPPSNGRNKPSKKAANLTEPVDINRASAAELQKLPGIGPTLAQRIVDERRKGRFKSVDDLRRVRGVKAKKIDALRPYATVGRDLRVVTLRPGDV